MSSVRKNLNIVLVGKTGNGKSSTGNSILGMNKFEEKDSFTSNTHLITVHVAKVDAFTYTVYDTKGFCDADIDEKEDIRISIKHMTRLMKECPSVDVFLLVLRFSILSAEDYKPMPRLRQIFGPNFIKDHCYVIFTHGDNYGLNIPFVDHCEQSTGKFRDLYNECGKRIFMISNKGGFEESSTRIVQGKNLIEKLQTWLANKSPYKAKPHFADAEPQRKLLAFEADKDNIRLELERRIDELKKEIDNLKSSNKAPSLNTKGQLHVLHNDIRQADPHTNTKYFDDLLNQVTTLINEANSLPTLMCSYL